MKKLSSAMRLICALSSVLFCACLISGALSIFLSFDPGADESMYTPSVIGAHFSSFAPVYIALCFILIVSAIIGRNAPSSEKKEMYVRSSPLKSARILRRCAFILSALLIVLGIMNGGLRDVFVKAVNICTECIGLG